MTASGSATALAATFSRSGVAAETVPMRPATTSSRWLPLEVATSTRPSSTATEAPALSTETVNTVPFTSATR
jgi:hypothetical protein